MEITKSNIENIRRAAKAKGLSPSSDDIKVSVTEFYSNESAMFDTKDISAIVDLMLSKQLPQPIAKPEVSIILSEKDKQEVVTATAKQAGISLVGEEIKQVASSIASGFDSREQMLADVVRAIVAFADYKLNLQNDAIADAANQIKKQLSSSNNNIKNSLSGLSSDIESVNSDFKSSFTDIKTLFTIPSKA